jgi:ribosomal protein L34
MTLSRRRAEPATPEGRAVLQTVVPPAFPAPLCPEAYRAHRNSDFPREQLRGRGVGPSVTGRARRIGFLSEGF